MNKKQINKIMEETCFSSLSFCCNKECPIRNKVIKKLGLTKKDFVALKEKFNNNLYSLIKNKKLKGGKNGK